MGSVAADKMCPLCHCADCAFYFQDNKNAQHTYSHCPNCDLVFVVSSCRLDSVTEKSRYDMHENDESQHYIDFLLRLAQPMRVRLSPLSSGLDFGSGKSPAMANLFRQFGHNCTCYDIYYHPDQSCLDESYDFVIASEVIEHLYEPKSVFEQWISLLKPNGLLGIMTGFRPSDEQFSNWWYKNDPTHVMLFSEQSFAYLQSRYRLTCVYQAKNVIIFQNQATSTYVG